MRHISEITMIVVMSLAQASGDTEPAPRAIKRVLKPHGFGMGDGDPYGGRTHIAAVKERCPNH